MEENFKLTKTKSTQNFEGWAIVKINDDQRTERRRHIEEEV